MRRFWTALLAFFGLLCITAAIAIPTYLVPKLKVVPLDLDITSVSSTVPAEGTDAANRLPATIFDRCSIGQKKAATFAAHLTQQRRSAIVDPSNEDQATVQSAQMVRIDEIRNAKGEESKPTLGTFEDDKKCSDAMLTATIDRVSVNRKTSEPNGAISSLQLETVTPGEDPTDVSVPLEERKGFQYKFPFNTQKREYYYYDLNTRQDTVAKFVDETEINGLKVYHFSTEVPETDISDLPNPAGDAPLGTILEMPASWWGVSGKGVKGTDRLEMHRFAAATREVWVEPITGTIVDGREAQHQYFRSVDDSDDVPAAVRDFRMDAMKGTFKWSDETVTNQADRAKHYVNLLNIAGKWLPIGLGILGALLTLWAIIRTFRGGRDDDDEHGRHERHDDGDGSDLDDQFDAADYLDVPDDADYAPATEALATGQYGYEPGYEASGYEEPTHAHEAPTYAYESPTVAEPTFQYEAPTYDAPTYDAPIYDAPTYETEAFEAPTYEAPRYEPQPYEPQPYEPQPYVPTEDDTRPVWASSAGQGLGQLPSYQRPQPPLPDLPNGFSPLDDQPGRHERPE